MIEQGRQPPAPYYDQPEIPIGLMFYWNAFSELGTERQIGMGLGPIPRSKIRDYAAEHEIAGDAAEFFFSVMRMMDDEYLSLANSSSKQNDNEYSVPVDDVAGAHRLMGYFKQRAKHATVKHKKQPTRH